MHFFIFYQHKIKCVVSHGLNLHALCAVTQGLKLRAYTRFRLLTVAE